MKATSGWKPESPLNEATATMRMRDYSQLPVMKTDRDVSGIITWTSIGARLSLGQEYSYVRQCMEQPFSIETLPDLPPDVMSALWWVECVTVLLFTAEYICRLAVAERPWRFARSFFGIVGAGACT